MEVDRHLKLMALDMACERLSKRMKSLAKAGFTMDPTKLDGIDRSVTRALAALGEDVPVPAGEKEKKPPSTSLLKRMLRGKDLPEDDSETPIRSHDTPPSAKHILAFRGFGSCVPIPDLLRFLKIQQSTGMLEVATSAEVYAVEIDKGDILHIQVSRAPQGLRLGDVLVSQNIIDREMLEVMRKLYTSERLGEVLLRQKLVTREQLFQALQTQIQLQFDRLFVAPMIRFSFWAGPPVNANRGIRISAVKLILDSRRAHEKKSAAKAKSA